MKRLLKVPRWAERLQYLMLSLASGVSLPGVVRVSFGLQTSRQDIDVFLQAMKDITSRAPKTPKKSFRRGMDTFVDDVCRKVLAPPA